MTQHQQIQRQKAQATLWRRGELDFLLDSNQLGMKKAFLESSARSFAFLCSRRLGKSFLLCALASELCIRKPGIRIVYITATRTAAKNIVVPIMGELFVTAPDNCRAEYKTQDSKFVFPNGSQILLYGADRDPNAVRGQAADFILLDEAGFIDRLDYLISSVLMPMLLTTGGRILMASTPPEDLDHPFMAQLAECEAQGALIKRTIYDCPRFTPKMIAEEMERQGGEQSAAWQREYLCKILRNEQRTVIPEFDDETAHRLVLEVPRNPNWDRYVSMDLGWTDDTALVFGFYDFANAKVVIEDELIIKQKTTGDIAASVRAKEQNLWGSGPPYKRIADSNNPQLLADLSASHDLYFSPVNKTSGKEAMINRLRTMILQGSLLIHPRCRQLIAQLKYCKWKGSSRAEFDRNPLYGHFDLVDALIYLVNSINRARNPVTTNYPVSDYYLPTAKPSHPFEQAFPAKFRPPSKIKRFR